MIEDQTIKRVNRLFMLTLGLLTLAGAHSAQTPAEQLPQMVTQLQKTRTDRALREKIIKLGTEIKPAPVVPDEAIRFEGRAQYAFKKAQSVSDYLEAAKEYENAVFQAPWVLGYYSDLCTIYEKAGKIEDAKLRCEFYLIGLADTEEITKAKLRIAGLEFAIEKAAGEEAKRKAAIKAEQDRIQQAAQAQQQALANKRQQADQVLRSLNGAEYQDYSDPFFDEGYLVQGNTLVVYWASKAKGTLHHQQYGDMPQGVWKEVSRIPWYEETSSFYIKAAPGVDRNYYLSADGTKLTGSDFIDGKRYDHVINRWHKP